MAKHYVYYKGKMVGSADLIDDARIIAVIFLKKNPKKKYHVDILNSKKSSIEGIVYMNLFGEGVYVTSRYSYRIKKNGGLFDKSEDDVDRYYMD